MPTLEKIVTPYLVTLPQCNRVKVPMICPRVAESCVQELSRHKFPPFIPGLRLVGAKKTVVISGLTKSAIPQREATAQFKQVSSRS
jgi:hypothetical protein